MNNIMITGAAGFIGYYLSKKLLENGEIVYGVDNLNDYYDPELKKARLKQLQAYEKFTHINKDISDRSAVEVLFQTNNFDVVVNLAAQAGVRYSLVNPHAYIDTNVVGFANLLEGCRHSKVKHFVFASSSSVYGANTKMPFSIHDNVDHPVSLYAASKKSNELMAHAYSHLFGLPVTGLRFFTVYGPWGRPDMAYFIFTKAILEGTPINIFNQGKSKRDFTYIDDIIEGVYRIIYKIPEPNSEWNGNAPDPSSSYCPYKIYNIGNNQQVELMHFVEVLENCLGKKAEKNFLPLQNGDVPETYANVDDLVRDVDFKPNTPVNVGLREFVDWYRNYYRI